MNFLGVVLILLVTVSAGIGIVYILKYERLRHKRAEDVVIDPTRLTHHEGTTGELFRPVYLKVRGVEYLAFVIDDSQMCIRDAESKIFSKITNSSGQQHGTTVH